MFELNSNSGPAGEVVKPKHTFNDLIYPEHITGEIKSILDEEQFSHALIEEGLHPKRKILLYGPSGCGKTSIAHAIASELKVDLLIAPPNALQSPYVGESEKTIAATIKQACETKCVLLIDEFDSIAMSRQNSTNRYATSVVGTLLTSLENGTMDGFLVACTNHIDHLDQALLRRFDAVFEIPLPSISILREIAAKILRGRYDITVDQVMEGAGTPALVERNAKQLLRNAVIAAEKKSPRPKKVVVQQEKGHTSAPEYGLDRDPFNGQNPFLNYTPIHLNMNVRE